MSDAAKKLEAASPGEALLMRVSSLVMNTTGVQLGPARRAMIQSRLLRRMSKLGIADEELYLKYLDKNMDTELEALVSLLTTHHTHFFREYVHFEFLEKTALPALIEARRRTGRKKIRIWSAAASYGQEAYSLAMFLTNYFKQVAPDFDFEIFGSDVDVAAVSVARNGVYRWDELKQAPAGLIAGHWARGTGDIADYVRAKESLRSRCTFEPVNLIDPTLKGVTGVFDVIFCRNVYIYFSPEQIQRVTDKLVGRLSDDGYFVVGLSESIGTFGGGLRAVGPSVYAKAAPLTSAVAPLTDAAKPARPALAPRPAAAKALRVLCVDDSPTVLTLLKRVFSEEAGFRVVGTAANGAEAEAFLRNNAVDVMTLDIHMPVMNGVDYLSRNRRPGHPPVVVVSSVSREDMSLGIKSLELGARDYVEKPTFATLAQKTEELRFKVRNVALSAASASTVDTAIERSFARKTDAASASAGLYFVLTGLDDREKWCTLFQGWSNSESPACLIMEGARELAPLAEAFLAPLGLKPELVTPETKTFQPGRIYLADPTQAAAADAAKRAERISCIVLGGASTKLLQAVSSSHQHASWLFEEKGEGGGSSATHRAGRSVPTTSLMYHAKEHLEGFDAKDKE